MADFPLNEEQRPAVEEHDQHLLLAAGAGSGKTRVLVERYLRILADGGWDPALPARLLAITFTEKAAREMRERVLRGLEERASVAEDGALASRLLAVAREMESAPVSTIHGFCSRLLRENATEAGLDPRFTVPDEVSLDGLRREVLDRLLEEGDADLALLAGEFGVDRVGDAIDELHALRRSLGLPSGEPLGWDAATEAARLRERVRALREDEILAWQAELPARLSALCAHFEGGEHPQPDGRRKLAAARALLDARDLGRLDPETLPLLAETLKGMRGAGKGIEDGGRMKSAWEELKKEIAERAARVARLGDESGTAGRPAGLDVACLRLQTRYSHLLHGEMRARGWLDFEDLQLEALRLLEGNRVLRERVRRQYRQVLVDEFQDTYRLQLRLVRLLVPEDADPARNTLFLVGDHRQSIYAFRNADVELFRREAERMKAGGEAAPLRRNYRSHPSLLRFYNTFFPPDAFPPMEAWRQGDDGPRVTLQLSAQGELNRAAARLLAARLLARSLREAWASGLAVEEDGAARPLEWRDVAILVRSSSGIGPIARALAEEGIPYEAAGGREYFLRQELLDLEDLLAALDDPYQPLKLARGLRGDPIGLSTADLLLLLPPSQRRGGWEATRDRGELLARLERAAEGELELSADGRHRVARFLALRRRLAGRLHRLPLRALVADLVEASGFDLKAATDRHALKIQRNLRQLADLVAELESARRITVREFLDHMRRVREISPRREEAWVPEEGGSLLRILTIHSAKGLEFPLVVVADLDRELGRGQHLADLACLRADFADGSCEALLGVRWRDPENGKHPDWVHDWIDEEKERREEAENLRLLYVAMTRARDHLVLSGILPGCSQAETRGGLPESRGASKAGFLDMTRAALRDGVPEEAYRLHLEGETEIPGPSHGRTPPEAPATTADVTWRHLLAGTADVAVPELSVTSLALLASCPLRWLLEQRLGLRRLFAERGEAWIPERNEDAPGGAAFGSLLHEILARWDFRTAPAEAFAAACPAGLPPGRREDAERVLSVFFAGEQPWLRRLHEAGDFRREEPFVLDLGDVLLTGQTDLVFEWERQRILVDWKSDRVSGRTAIDKRLGHHQYQLLLYALALRESGCPVDQALVAFLRAGEADRPMPGEAAPRVGEFRQVEIDTQQLEWAANRARKLGRSARLLSHLDLTSDPGAALPELPLPKDPPCRGCPFRKGPCVPGYRPLSRRA